MPYNVNPPCQETQQLLITWEYPGSPQQQNSQGDDYRISISFVDCRYRVSAYIPWNAEVTNGAGAPGYNASDFEPPNVQEAYFSRPAIIPDITGSLIPVRDNIGRIRHYKVEYTAFVGNFGTATFQAENVLSLNRSGDRVKEGSLVVGDLVINNDYRNRNCQKYILEILKEGEVIFTDKGLQEPLVAWVCIDNNQCPENTCEVICGDTICCYGSDGIAVDSFPRT